MATYTTSLLPNPFRAGSALFEIAERLKRKPRQRFGDLVAGLDIADPYHLLRYAQRVYARRRQRLTVSRGRVVLQ